MRKYRFLDKEHRHQLSHGTGYRDLYGTTTILDILGKPLAYWASGMACSEFGWIPRNKDADGSPIKKGDKERTEARLIEVFNAAHIRQEQIKAMSYKEYADLLDRAYHAHRTKKEEAAVDGVTLHAELEAFVRSQIDGTPFGQSTCLPEHWENVQRFAEWAKFHVKQYVFSEMHCYSELLWVGGICDLAYIDHWGRLILGDFKSAKDFYFSNFCQLGGYDIQLIENGGFTKDGDLIWTHPAPIQGHATFYFGAKTFEPAITYDVERDKRAFVRALELYKDRESFNTEFGKEN